MKVKCPTCGKEIEYSSANPWRPFCSERCKLIDLGEWASDGYVIEGDPGSADRMTPEELRASPATPPNARSARAADVAENASSCRNARRQLKKPVQH